MASIRSGPHAPRTWVLRAGVCVLVLVLAAPALCATDEVPDSQKAASLFYAGLGVYRELSAKKGAKILARAAALDPSNGLYAIYLSDALYMSGDRIGSNEVAAEISKLLRDQALVCLFKGKREQRKGNEETALYEFRESLLCEPTPYAFYELAALEIKRGDLDAADVDLAIGLKQFPEDYFLHNLRGTVRHEQGHYAQAIESFDAAIESNPTLPFARVNRGLALYETGEYDKAIADYDAVLSVYPDLDRAKFLKALALAATKRYGAARQILDELAKTHADDPALWLAQGWIYYKTGKARQGEKLLLQYVKEMPDDPEGHYKLATLYAGRRKSRSAFTTLRRALELNYTRTMEWVRANAEWDRYRDTRKFRRLLDDTKPE